MSDMSSTYGVLTAQRILQNHHIELSQAELLQAVSQPDNRFYPVLHCSFDLIYAQLILDQAHTYLVVAQQTIVDILLNRQQKTGSLDEDSESSESVSGEEAQVHLVALQKELQDLNQQESDEKFFLQELVAETQDTIGDLLKNNMETIENIQMALRSFIQRTEVTQKNILDFRAKIRDWMIRMNQVILVLPDYKQDPIKRAQQVEMLEMMSAIGYNAEPVNLVNEES